MDKAFHHFLSNLIIFVLFAMVVVGFLLYLCHDEAKRATKQEYESRIIVDDRSPALKELERKALTK